MVPWTTSAGVGPSPPERGTRGAGLSEQASRGDSYTFDSWIPRSQHRRTAPEDLRDRVPVRL